MARRRHDPLQPVVEAVGTCGPGVAWWTYGLSLLLLVAYPLLGFRIYRGRRGRGDAVGAAVWYAVSCVLGKFAQVLGQLRYQLGRIRGRPTTLIEYKGAGQK